MWAFVLKWLGFPEAPRPVPVRVDPAMLREDWNGTVLSGETYR